MGVFDIGILLGTSDSSHRHSVVDITRNLLKESQDRLADFNEGEKNLTVAMEGIDTQARGGVIQRKVEEKKEHIYDI